MSKAKKVLTVRDTYFTTIEYEYRNHKYDVTYANGFTCACTPARVQHRDEQEKIDKMIERERQTSERNDLQNFDEQIDDIWELMGWN